MLPCAVQCLLSSTCSLNEETEKSEYSVIVAYLAVKTHNISLFDRKVLRKFEPDISNFFQKIYNYFLAIVFLLPLFIPSNKPKSRIYTLLPKGKTTSQFLTNFSEPYTTYMEIF